MEHGGLEQPEQVLPLPDQAKPVGEPQTLSTTPIQLQLPEQGGGVLPVVVVVVVVLSVVDPVVVVVVVVLSVVDPVVVVVLAVVDSVVDSVVELLVDSVVLSVVVVFGVQSTHFAVNVVGQPVAGPARLPMIDRQLSST